MIRMNSMMKNVQQNSSIKIFEFSKKRIKEHGINQIWNDTYSKYFIQCKNVQKQFEANAAHKKFILKKTK